MHPGGRALQNTFWKAAGRKLNNEMAGARPYMQLLAGATTAVRMLPRMPRRSFMVTALRRSQAPAQPAETPPELATLTGKPTKKVTDIADQIVALNMVEVTELIDLLKIKLNLTGLQFGVPMMAAPGAGGGGDQGSAAQAGGAAEKKEEKKEKTEFSLKLDSFNAADKLKVIKEIRAITGLGLKESKDLVEGAPKTIKEGVSKEDAEKLKKQIEDAGGKVSIA